MKKGLATALVSALALLGALTGAPAAADQRDSRLDALFSGLKSSADPRAAVAVEAQIWGIWGETGDPAVQGLMALGVAAMARRDHRAALGKFDQIVRIAPGFAEGWNKRATVHYLLGNYKKSLGDIRKTLTLEPRHFGALSGRGLVYVQLDQEARALKAFEAALVIHPHLSGSEINAETLRRWLKDRSI